MFGIKMKGKGREKAMIDRREHDYIFGKPAPAPSIEVSFLKQVPFNLSVVVRKEVTEWTAMPDIK